MQQTNENLNKQLKRLVITLGLTIIMGGIALIIAYNVKNKLNHEDTITTLVVKNAINDNFSAGCQPLIIEYKENYIAINSKKCNKMLIINTNTGKEFYKHY